MTRPNVRAILVAILLGAVVVCGADGIVGVVVVGKPLQAGPAPEVIGETVCGPVGPCARLAGAEVAWDADAKTMAITRSGAPRITLTVGSAQAQIGERAVPLGRKVEVRGASCYGPLAVVLEALGCRVHWDKGAGVLLANGLLTGVNVWASEEGAKVLIETSAPIAASLVTIGGPPRRYVDLVGIELAQRAAETRYIYTGPLLRVRIGQQESSPPAARVVADLWLDGETTWQPSDDGRGGAIIIGSQTADLALVERNLPKLTEVTTLQPRAGLELFRASLDWQVKPTWDVFAKPPRITLTFPEVESRIEERSLPMCAEFVDHVELSYAEAPPSTTLTLFLRELMNFKVRSVPTGGAEVVFRRERLRDKKVAIDPGHGGRDKGAVGRVLQEKAVNLDVAIRTVRRLQTLGVRAFLTRLDDTFIDLFARPESAKRLGADMFVSIHCNAMPRRNHGHGTETFYYWRESKCLGLIMQDALVRGLGRADRGLKHARFVVIRKAEMPAVLVELMFLNHNEEEALMQQDSTREASAAAIVEGLRQFVEGTGSVPSKRRGAAGLSRL